MNRETKYYLDLVIVLTLKDLKSRYKNSFLGYLWSILHPLAFALTFFIAFKIVMRIQMENYALFLVAGMFPWQWFSNSVTASPVAFLGNVTIIKKINFPRNFIPLTVVLQDMIHFLLSIPVIVLFLFIYHKSPSLLWIYGVPLLLAIQFLFTYGVCLMISSLNLFFRDLERLAAIFTMLLFYFTPIIYSETMIPERYRFLATHLNPLASLMLSWRNLLLNGVMEPLSLIISFAYALLALSMGYWVYRKLSWRFAEVL